MDLETVLYILAGANLILWLLIRERELRAIRAILDATLGTLTGLEIVGLASYGLGILLGFKGALALCVGGAGLTVALLVLLTLITAIPSLWRFLNHAVEVKLYAMAVGIGFSRVVALFVIAEMIFTLLYPTADPTAKSLLAITIATWQDTLCLVAAPFVLGAWFYATSPWVTDWRRAGGRLVI